MRLYENGEIYRHDAAAAGSTSTLCRKLVEPLLKLVDPATQRRVLKYNPLLYRMKESSYGSCSF